MSSKTWVQPSGPFVYTDQICLTENGINIDYWCVGLSFSVCSAARAGARSEVDGACQEERLFKPPPVPRETQSNRRAWSPLLRRLVDLDSPYKMSLLEVDLGANVTCLQTAWHLTARFVLRGRDKRQGITDPGRLRVPRSVNAYLNHHESCNCP